MYVRLGPQLHMILCTVVSLSDWFDFGCAKNISLLIETSMMAMIKMPTIMMVGLQC